jgi:hypothetical protein
MDLWDVMVSIFWFMMLVAWFWMLMMVFSDLFRDAELSGVAKAAWCCALLLLPWAGVLIYLLVRGRSMGDRAAAVAMRNEKAFRSYVQEAASSGGGVADELSRLTEMRDGGQITPQEYELAKQRVLGTGPTATPAAAGPRADGTPLSTHRA